LSNCDGNDIEEGDHDCISAVALEEGIIRDIDLTVMMAIVLPMLSFISEDDMSHTMKEEWSAKALSIK
jgi:hypothetical protein